MNTGILNPQQFGERVRRLRQRLGYTQGELAEAAGHIEPAATVGQSQISTIENGGSFPSVQGLRALAIALETNTDYLLGLSEDDSPPSDRDDQVIATIEDPTEKAVVQAIIDALAKAPRSDKLFVADLLQRVLPKKTRIVGGE